MSAFLKAHIPQVDGVNYLSTLPLSQQSNVTTGKIFFVMHKDVYLATRKILSVYRFHVV